MQRFFGGMLMAVGILIGSLCGLCTAGFQIVFTVMVVQAWLSGSGASDSGQLLLPVLFGGIPTLTGIGLFSLGRWLHRTSRA